MLTVEEGKIQWQTFHLKVKIKSEIDKNVLRGGQRIFYGVTDSSPLISYCCVCLHVIRVTSMHGKNLLLGHFVPSLEPSLSLCGAKAAASLKPLTSLARWPPRLLLARWLHLWVQLTPLAPAGPHGPAGSTSGPAGPSTLRSFVKYSR